ncbi:hypothetical protein RRG08_021826 [Elysia crispata]|uniref:ribonuclease H n=1 Tax=Elysia crispata TaxID=231223 RepID=A0AAE0ZZD1_9GAST|nr:hypothetical protein RRG08_021826 [Elysia crispata]
MTSVKTNTRRVYRYLICCMLRFACRSCCLLFTMSKSGPWFYAVKHGRVPGVYNTWPECESQVKGFPKPIYKKFFSLLDAQKFVADEGIISTIPSGGTYFNTSMATPTSNHKNTMSSCMTASPCSSQNTVSTPRGAPVTLTSVNFEVTKMQGTINSLFGMMESLRSDVGHILDIVKRIETAAFIAPGTKRNFSTMAKEPDAMRDRKQSKKDKGNVGGFTGSNFEEEDGVHVYTDGGCFDNGRNGARAGIGVYWGRDDPNNISEALSGRPSNNRAEIHAALKAVQIAKKKGIKNLIIHTDSQFLINGITKWIKGWKRNGWKLTTGHPVINKDDFSALDNELLGISVKWIYVKGHSGNPANEEADRLAKQGAEKAGLT